MQQQTLTLAYDAEEDRVLAASNLGQTGGWSCWLTQRLVLAVLERSPAFVHQTSGLAQRTPIDFRSDLIQFEREAALVQTAKAMSATGNEVLRAGAAQADLIQHFNLTPTAEEFILELRGRGGATLNLNRPQLQRVLQMLADEAARGGWTALAAPPAEASQEAPSKPLAN